MILIVGAEECCVWILEFIGKLEGLVPDRNLKLICYYGLYSRRTKGRFQPKAAYDRNCSLL
jgi:hypothetical protein